MVPVNAIELHGSVPTTDVMHPYSNSQDGLTIPINYVMHAFTAHKGSNCLKDLTAPSFPIPSTIPQVIQQQVTTEMLTAPPIPVNTTSTSIPQSIVSPVMCLQDQPMTVYNIPVTNGSNVQGFIFSTPSPGNPCISYQGVSSLPMAQNVGYIPLNIDSRQLRFVPVPDSQKRVQAFGTSTSYKSTRIKWSAEMNKDLENVYDSLLAAHVRPTQRVVHEIMKEKYPFMTELHVQSKLQKLRQMKKTVILQKDEPW